MRYYVTSLHGGLQIRDGKTGADVPCDFYGSHLTPAAAREIARLMDEADERVRREMGAVLDRKIEDRKMEGEGLPDSMPCDGCGVRVARLDLYPVGGENDRMLCPACCRFP